MSANIDLVILNGPLEGEVVQLHPKKRLILGRAAGTVQIPDRLVSMKHAEISWAGDSYWVEDVGSATGTWVDEKRLGDHAAALRPGTRLRLGETEFEVRDRPRSTGLRFVGAIAAAVILLLGIRTFMQSIDIDYQPVVRWFEPVHLGAGATTDLLPVPTGFIRETGVDHRQLRIVRVTDHDRNGVDELWLELPDEDRVVTFDVEGNWRTLGVLPKGCRARGDEGPGFPDLGCGGIRWSFVGNRYTMQALDGVVVWMPPVQLQGEDKAVVEVVDGAPNAHAVSFVRPEMFAGFLAARGVEEPVHYLICEDSLPGIRAQVRTMDGRILGLERPCLRDVVLEGVTKEQVFGPGQPRMVAFTAHGRDALLDDLGMYLDADPTGLIIQGPKKAFLDAMSALPTTRGGAFRLRFEGEERLFDPIAREQQVPGGPMTPLGTPLGPVGLPVPRVVRIDGPGRVELESCGALRVQTGPWHCLFAKGCGSTSTFVSFDNDTCGTGQQVAIPYARGTHPFKDGRLSGAVVVESIDEGGQIDALRVRMVYRVAKP